MFRRNSKTNFKEVIFLKITDMTDTLFNKEMQRLLSDAAFWCIKLSQIGKYTLEPTPVSNIDGSNPQPFPLAMELKEVWDYAKGETPAPYHLYDSIQALTELLWSTIGSASYKIPNSWWSEPLGFMCQLAMARENLDSGADLNAKQLSLLSGYTHARIKQLCSTGELQATKVEQGRSSQLEWAIPADVAKEWLSRR
jgi:hypothetical protein